MSSLAVVLLEENLSLTIGESFRTLENNPDVIE
jgi:hypothetical protein